MNAKVATLRKAFVQHELHCPPEPKHMHDFMVRVGPGRLAISTEYFGGEPQVTLVLQRNAMKVHVGTPRSRQRRDWPTGG